MDCNEARNRLHAYLDQELDLPNVAEIDRHIASCAACRRTLKQLSALQSGVRKHAQYHIAPDAVAERIRARIGVSEGGSSEAPEKGSAPGETSPLESVRRASRYPRFARWLELGAAAAAAATVAWLGALQYAYRSPSETIAEQVIAGHARAVITSHVVDIETSDQHTVKPWLSSKLDFSPPVVDLDSAGFPLAGGRLDYLDHRPVATLVYHARQHIIDLYVWPDQSSSSIASAQTLSKDGYNVVHWRDVGMQYWAISDLNAAELETFAARYSEAQ